MKLPPIGHSTGWLSAKVTCDLDFHNVALLQAGATAIEVVEGTEQRLKAFEFGQLSADFEYRSIHLADFRTFSGPALEVRTERLSNIIKHLGLQGASLHPDAISTESLACLMNRQIPFGLENMDRQKEFGKNSKDLLSQPKDIPLVIDLQHAYENIFDDPSQFMTLITDLCDYEKTGRKIIHLHISGEYSAGDRPDNNHMPVHLATNRDYVLRLLKELYEIYQSIPPIILEGDYLFDHPYNTEILSSDDRDHLIDLASVRMKTEINWLSEQISDW